jgi:hypothetical protein
MCTNEICLKIDEHMSGEYLIQFRPAVHLQQGKIEGSGFGENLVIDSRCLQKFVHPLAHGDVALAQNIDLAFDQRHRLAGFVRQAEFGQSAWVAQEKIWRLTQKI